MNTQQKVEILDDTSINIISESTVFFSCEFHPEINIDILLDKKKKLLSTMKEHNITYNYSSPYFTKIKNLKEQYETDYIEYYFLYQEILTALKKEQNTEDGLSTTKLNSNSFDYLYQAKNLLNDLTLSKTLISAIEDVDYKITAIQKVFDETNFLKVIKPNRKITI